MDLLANELSVHEQFDNDHSFYVALDRLMSMRAVAQRFGGEIHCHRSFLNRKPRLGVTLQPAVRRLPPDKRRVFMSWLTRGGPFWDDTRRHSGNDYLESRGKVVTDSSVGEAAYRVLRGQACGLVSLKPSNWDYSPVQVSLWNGNSDATGESAAVPNWRDPEALTADLQAALPVVRKWADLQTAIGRYSRLKFSDDCLEPLRGLPFSKRAARAILSRLEVLDWLAADREGTGSYTAAGHQVIRDYFHGENAWFSDSSPSEKRVAKFRQDMTFPHPERSDEVLFCSWHGKVRTQQLRIHFSWPEQPIYVVYIGQKITRR